MANTETRTPKIWIFVVDSRNHNDLSDLDHFDDILWGANPNTQKGDMVLMYRTRPYSDIAYVFAATSNPRLTEIADRADMKYVIELGEKTRLSNPITLRDLRNNARLSEWSFALNQQGVMRRRTDIRDEGFWQDLRALIVRRNPTVAPAIAELEGLPKRFGRTKHRHASRGRKSRRPQLRVFISYSSTDLTKVSELYDRLSNERGLDLWFDKKSLVPGDNWQYEITRAIRLSDVIVICLSAGSVLRRGFSQREIKWALEKADEQPEGTTSIIPVKLEPCNVPPRLARVAHYAELYKEDEDGYERIVSALRKRSSFIEATSGTDAEPFI